MFIILLFVPMIFFHFILDHFFLVLNQPAFQNEIWHGDTTTT
jgi:hypothetical protein